MVPKGNQRIEHCKRGNLSSLSLDDAPPLLPPPDGEAPVGAPPRDVHGLERQEVARLQKADPEFVDLIFGFQVNMEGNFDLQQDFSLLAFCKRLSDRLKLAHRLQQ